MNEWPPFIYMYIMYTSPSTCMHDYDCVGLCASCIASIFFIPIKFNVPHHMHPSYVLMYLDARTCICNIIL